MPPSIRAVARALPLLLVAAGAGTPSCEPAGGDDDPAAGDDDTSAGDDATGDDDTTPDDDVSSGDDDTSAGDPWHLPDCAEVAGTGSVTFTLDEGATLVPTSTPLMGTRYTFGLAALDRGDTLLAEAGGDILRSLDAGCTWTIAEEVPYTVLRIDAAAGGRAYAWEDNGSSFLRIEQDGTVVDLGDTLPAVQVVGLGVHPVDGARVRVATSELAILESNDGGETWIELAPAPSGASAYRAAFDPHDPDRVFAGLFRDGLWVTGDGGGAWEPAGGLSSTGGPVNVFNVVCAPANPAVVWAMGLDLDQADAGDPTGGKHLYRSADGGATFEAVVDQGGGITLVNGPLLAAHPTDEDVLYFVFGTSAGDAGTDLYRYEHGTGGVTSTHNGYHDITALAFHPADPGVVYLGLAHEEID